MAGRLYDIDPILPHFGGVVRNFSLNGDGPLSDELVAQIKSDMTQYRVVLFKGQGLISGARQVEISQRLGEIESTFYKHPASPHPDIFRVSNDEAEGCTRVGTTGWHLDGTFQAMPFKYQTMHFHSVCEGGATWFVPLKDFYELQDEETKSRWDRLWFVSGSRELAHPLVFEHPSRKDTTMCFHCGDSFCAGWDVDDDAANPRDRRPKGVLPAEVVQEELSERLDKAVDRIGLKMDWEVGDFAINDNLGNVHYAPPGTQSRKSTAGLRVLHRTTIAGEDVPTKVDGRSSYRRSARRGMW